MRLRVWDLPTRLFHWLLVGAVATCAVSGFLLPSRWLGWHFAAGYLLAALLAFRLVWAFFGPEHSRWPGFCPKPGAVIAHLRAVAAGRPHTSIGHNPAGGAMILALLLTLTLLALSGLLTVGGMLKQGPFAFFMPYDAAMAVKELHEAAANLLMALAATHILGVVVESRLLREWLIGAMITGWKRAPDGSAPPRARAPMAAALAVAAVAAVIGGGLALSRLPKAGWHPLTAPAAYTQDCGSCHMAYHPSLLSAASWRQVMAHLDTHYGEDASLPAPRRDAIAQWLTANAAEQWDTLAAHRLGRAPLAADGLLTSNSWWKRKHRHLEPAVFQRTAIKTAENCAACHRDATSGLFNPQAIVIPNP